MRKKGKKLHFANWSQAKQVIGAESAEIFRPPLTPRRKLDSVPQKQFPISISSVIWDEVAVGI